MGIQITKFKSEFWTYFKNTRTFNLVRFFEEEKEREKKMFTPSSHVFYGRVSAWKIIQQIKTTFVIFRDKYYTTIWGFFVGFLEFDIL